MRGFILCPLHVLLGRDVCRAARPLDRCLPGAWKMCDCMILGNGALAMTIAHEVAPKREVTWGPFPLPLDGGAIRMVWLLSTRLWRHSGLSVRLVCGLFPFRGTSARVRYVDPGM